MEREVGRRATLTEPSDFGMPHPNEAPFPHATRMRAIGELLARGIRRLDNIRRMVRPEVVGQCERLVKEPREERRA